MSAEKKTRVLLTGASGLVGSILRKEWGDRYWLRLADIRDLDVGTTSTVGDAVEIIPLRPEFEEFVQLDTSDLHQFVDACHGIDVVVHLAADASPSADFYGSLLDRNVKSTCNLQHSASCSLSCRLWVVVNPAANHCLTASCRTFARR
jgi:NAD+ dependent glucose-6-phosphate dehydrogenase|eukprot:COSAG02_NODE_1913_length_10405_cov_3.734330_3_plen_148_part_00